MAKLIKNKQIKERTRPIMPWQVGEYDAVLDCNIIIPYQALLLCRLMDIPPLQIIKDFLNNLSCACYSSNGGDEAKAKLIDYFIAHGYGQQYYSEPEIKKVFKEMEALKMLFPDNGSSELVDSYASWREQHYDYWFEKWFYHSRRSLHKPAEK